MNHNETLANLRARMAAERAMLERCNGPEAAARIRGRMQRIGQLIGETIMAKSEFGPFVSATCL